MTLYPELEYEDVVDTLYAKSEDELYNEYYSEQEECYSYSPDWSNHHYYTEFWEET